jgi:hypothetical protein
VPSTALLENATVLVELSLDAFGNFRMRGRHDQATLSRRRRFPVAMLIFTPEGPRAVEEADVLALYRGKSGDKSYQTATLCMASGEEVAGFVLKAALNHLEATIDDFASGVLLEPAQGTKTGLRR